MSDSVVRGWDMKDATNKAFCATFFLLPISKPLTFVSLTAALLLFLASGELRKALPALRKMPWMIPALVLAAVPVLALPFHGQTERPHDLDLSHCWVIAFATALAASRMSIQPWLRAFIIGVAAVACYSALSAALTFVMESRPASQGNYILYSQFLAIGIGLCAVLFHHERQRWWRMFYIAAAVAFFFNLTFSRGRSGMLALLALMPLVFARFLPSIGWGKILAACIVAVALMAMSPVTQERVEAAVQNLKMYRLDQARTSIGYRFEMWQTAWDVYLRHPVIGAGPEGFSGVWKRDLPRHGIEAKGFVEPHNAFLFYAARYGTLGLAPLIWLYGCMLWAGWRARHSMEGGVVLAFAIVCILGSLTNTMFMGAASRTWMMLFIGLQGALLHLTVQASSTSRFPSPAESG